MPRGIKTGVALGFVVISLMTAGAARASADLDQEASRMESELREQEEALDRKIVDLARVSERLEEAEGLASEAASRLADLKKETGGLGRSLQFRRAEAVESRERFQNRLVATYKGQQLDGVVLVLESFFNGDAGGDVLGAVAGRMLAADRESMRLYRDDRLNLSDTIRQLEEKQTESARSREDLAARAGELATRQAELEGAIQQLRENKGLTEAGLDDLQQRIEDREARERIEELKARQRDGSLKPPASGGGDHSREEEDRIAREDIVVEPVDELPLSSYRRLYREAAEDYGFGPDWYVLMAVGKIESNHGENMGPSSAGALGPMQFLPSTWAFAGVDGNGDGAANVMDPEDAIPAAAKYLADGGAPGDWYAALYTYNHADWYVREVLAVAEQYRLLVGDDSVGPYGVGSPSPPSTPSNLDRPKPDEPAPQGPPPDADTQPDEKPPPDEEPPPEETTLQQDPPESTSPPEDTTPDQQG